MNQKYKKSLGDRAFSIFNATIFILFSLICLIPIYYVFVLTVSDNKMASSGMLLLYPKGFHLDNYIMIFKLPGMAYVAFISIAKTVVGTTCSLIGSSFLAYLFTKSNMFMRKVLYRFVVISMYFSAGLIPWYINMKNLQLTNNFLGYILPYVVLPFYIILIKTYIESMPPSVEESAKIDGAGVLTIFIKIIMPLSKPIVATVAVFETVNQWNNLRDNLFLMTTEKLNTLQFVLYQYISQASALADKIKSSGSVSGAAMSNITPVAVQMTVAMVVTIPILFIYPFLQRYFAKGIMIGAVKG